MSAILEAGLDEVGYGAIAGPVISVVYALRSTDSILLPPGIRDSKQTTKAQRERLHLPMVEVARGVGLGHAWPKEIDELGVTEALHLSYRRALADLGVVPDILYVDGDYLVKGWGGKQVCEPKADSKYLTVSAASIIGKLFRDGLMAEYSKRFPQYGWERNSGYGSAEHEAAIRRFGLVVGEEQYVHRKRYCKKFLSGGELK